jgi:hypothetical protein
MMRSLIRCGALAGVIVLGACELVVSNPNNPGVEQVKATPADLQNFLGTQYRRWHSGLWGGARVGYMALVMSFEDFSTLSNNCLGQRVGIPRAANNNAIGNVCGGDQRTIYFQHSEVARGMADVLRRLDEPDFTFGTPAQDDRNRAFAEFLLGISLGYIAMIHDSAAVIDVSDPLAPDGTAIPQDLTGYQEVMAAALAALDRSIAAATSGAAGANGFPLPPDWMFTPTTMSSAEFVRVVRSYRARLRANVARSTAERAAVDWDAVIADATAGITTDHLITTSSITGPTNGYVNQMYSFSTWHQMTPFIIGMADNSGAYATWIAEPLSTRGASTPFLMVTDDLRWPQGTTRAAQQADFNFKQNAFPAGNGCNSAASVCKRYFANRPSGDDAAASPIWGRSNYNHVRFWSWRTAGSAGQAANGPFPFMVKAEMDLLAAEGKYRKGDFAGAAALVNISRTRQPSFPTTASPNTPVVAGAGLPAITAFDATTPVPGGNNCVPKKPSNAGPGGGGTIACGNLWEALKWEKRMETAYTHFMAWFLDSRGWGDLAEGTPIDWAAPFEDLQARGRIGSQIYSTGTADGYHRAPPSTYGW